MVFIVYYYPLLYNRGYLFIFLFKKQKSESRESTVGGELDFSRLKLSFLAHCF